MEASGHLVGPPVFNTGVTQQPWVRWVRFPSASARRGYVDARSVRHMGRLRSHVAVALVGALLLAGCSSVAAAEAHAQAMTFLTAAATDPEAACQLVAPGTLARLERDGGCVAALSALSGSSTGWEDAVTEVASQSAQVRRGDQAVFLARFDDGWRVTAAGCTRASADPALPYDCLIAGG